MACRLETFPEDEICAINEAVVQTNIKRGNWLLGGHSWLGRKLYSYFMLNLQQNRKMHLTNPRNVCILSTKFLPRDVFSFKKLLFSVLSS